MFLYNLKYGWKTKPVLCAVLLICMIAIFMVCYTAYGVLNSLIDFYDKPRTSRYEVYPKQPIASGELALPENLTDATEQVLVVSSANAENSTALVGVYSHDAWMPPNDVDVYWNRDMPIENLAQGAHVVWLNTGYYQLYEHIEPWIRTIALRGEEYSVGGMADYYFSEETYGRLLEATEGAPLAMDMQLPVPRDGYNNPYEFPNIVATVMMSGSDFSALNVPVAFIEIAFDQAPTYEQYMQMRQHFPSEAFDVAEYASGASGWNMASISVGVCAIALLFAMLLINSLVRLMLDAQAAVWRAMYLFGASRFVIVSHMIGFLAILYWVAAGIAAIPSYCILQRMAEIQVSICVDPRSMGGLSCASAALATLASLPVCLSATNTHSKEEDVYVQAI